MKKRLRNALFASLSFLILSYIYPGFSFESSEAIIYATAIFAFFYLFVRPILKLLSLPFNLLTFGLFGLVVNVLIIFLISYFIAGFDIVSFSLEELSVLGLSLPGIDVSTLFSVILASSTLSLISIIVFWIFS